MPSLFRIQVALTGFHGAPGVSTFYGNELDSHVAVASFFTGAANALAGQVNWSVPNSGDIIDEATGTITAIWTDGSEVHGVGGGGGAYVGSSGVVCSWKTGLRVGRRLLQGRTFLVPSATSVFDTDGNITSGVLTAVQGAGNALATSGKVNIYHRPTPAAPTSGISSPVISAHAPDIAAVLRSRRE